jgi:hypothetical protein
MKAGNSFLEFAADIFDKQNIALFRAISQDVLNLKRFIREES